MSKSTKWYNWVGDDIWDDYCKTAWLIWTPIVLLFLLIIGAACYNTFVRHI